MILQMHLQTAPRHGLVAVANIGAHHSQFVQNLPHQDTAGFNVSLSDQLLVSRARFLHPQVALQASEAKCVPTGGVYRVHQRLHAHATQQLRLCVVGVVVEVVLPRLVALSAAIAHDDVAHPLDLEAV